MTESIQAVLNAGLVPMLWGPPGVGKTRTVEALGRRLGRRVVTVVGSAHEPTDFSGLPVQQDGYVRFIPPGWAEQLGEDGILFLDEITTCPPSVQAVLLRVVLERTLGDYKLGEKVNVILAGNDPAITPNGIPLSLPMMNRIISLQFTVDPREWVKQFIPYWDNPPSISGISESDWRRARETVGAYIMAQPQMLIAPPKADEEPASFPSPRSWDAVSRLIAQKLDKEILHALIVGAVGDGAAMAFIQFLAELDLPDPEQIISNPDVLKDNYPKRIDVLYAVMFAVASRLKAEPTKDRWDAVWGVVRVIVENGHPDVAANLVQEIMPLRKSNWELPSDVRSLAPLVKEIGQ